MKDLLGTAKDRDEEYQRAINNVQDNTSLVTKTPWLRYNRWDKKFVGQDMKELHTLTDLLSATTIEETVISNTVTKILGVCWEGYHDCLKREWDLLPFWLRSVTLNKEDTKPFRSYIAPYTLTRYIGYWQSYILLCYRMYELRDPRLQFTRTQKQLLLQIQTLMHEYMEDRAEELEAALFKLSVALVCHYHYNPVTEPFSTSIIWGFWGCQMAGDARNPQMAVTEPPWLLLNPLRSKLKL